ncbi:PAS domain S-box protein [Flavobacterium sp. SUN046]|uniref:PAS domain S-box protein n=1 Tax=Flavobacterium sp. SUN046 TaxID=3002440 RepID=UPI002DBA6A7E|nr:PAS domain S-box protein [Flavobacterium sp. SUN046]MEC4048696.1 PAS domain S-box protein [Flavobacterium sp. SUN046]
MKKFWFESTNWLITKPKTNGVIIASLSFILVLIFSNMRYHIMVENERNEMSNVIRIVEQNLEQELNSATTTAISLALTINDKGKPEDFEGVSKQLLINNPYIDAVELLPKGIIQYVYPYEANKHIIGCNILATPEQKQDAEKTIRNKSMFFAGPMPLKQGGNGVVGRLPIFKNNTFWGFASIVIKQKTLEKAIGINQFKNKKYLFQLSKINLKTNKEEYFFPINTGTAANCMITSKIPEGNWNLYVINPNISNIWKHFIPSIFFGLLFSLCLGNIICRLLKKPAELTNLTITQARTILNSEVKFKTLFDQAPIGIIQVDCKSINFMKINQQFCDMIGYSEEELKQVGFQKIIHPEDLEDDLLSIKRILNGQIRKYSRQRRYVHKSGKIIWANLNFSALWKKGELPTHFIGIVEDITIKKEVEKNLKSSYELVIEQNKRLLNFSYIVSHNLRSHTSNINSISTLLENENDENEREELINLLKKVSDSLNETMYNLNEVINIQSNTHLNKEKLNLKAYLDNTFDILSEQINSKQVSIETAIDSDTLVKYNPAYLESILLNFVSNAIKYSSPLRKPVVTIVFNKLTNELSISDNGLGIDLKKHGDTLFGMYKTFHKNSDSRGIGLFITKNQIEAMGGTVSVDSKVDHGTTFTITFKN